MNPALMFLGVYLAIGVGFGMAARLGVEATQDQSLPFAKLAEWVFLWPHQYIRTRQAIEQLGKVKFSVDSGAKLEMPDWPPRDWDQEVALAWVDELKSHEQLEIEWLSSLRVLVESADTETWRMIFKREIAKREKQMLESSGPAPE